MQIEKQQDIDYMRSIANKMFSTIILQDYGDSGLDILIECINVISNFYKYIPLDLDYELVFYKRLSSANRLAELFPNDYTEVTEFSSFALNTSKIFSIEVLNENAIHVVVGELLDTDTLRDNCIVYKFAGDRDTLFGKVEHETLPQFPGATSYFSMPTYKSLDAALERYKVVIARKSDCDKILSVWFSPNKILFKKGPEDKLKKSLHRFLLRNVRGEVKEEQNVDDTKPVDIKVTFDFSSHIALIEVKWLGKSIEILGQKKPNQHMTDIDAVKGANQLANYLELHKPNAPTMVTKGYLVVFDGRRWQTNTNTTDINRKNGFHFENKEIAYTPTHHTIRPDFKKPLRFFMEPEITIV